VKSLRVTRPLLTSEHVPAPARHEPERSLNSPCTSGWNRTARATAGGTSRAFASDEITPTAGSACVVLLNSPRGQLAGVSEHAAYIICAALMKLCELPHRYTSSGVT